MRQDASSSIWWDMLSGYLLGCTGDVLGTGEYRVLREGNSGLKGSIRIESVPGSARLIKTGSPLVERLGPRQLPQMFSTPEYPSQRADI